jgi:hypothetical protein
MPVVVIAALIVFISALTASPDAAHFCAGKPEALAHCVPMAEMPVGEVPGQMPSADQCAEIEPMQSAIAPRCDDMVPGAPPLIAQSKLEPPVMPGGVALVAIAIAAMLGTIEALFRCTIYERPRSADHRAAEKKGVRRG